jgi:hypothetical protein
MLLIEAIRHVADPIPLPSATHGIQFSRKHRNAEKLVAVPGIEPGSQGPGGSPLKTKAAAVSASAKKKTRSAPARPNGETQGFPYIPFRTSPSSNYRLRWIVRGA